MTSVLKTSVTVDNSALVTGEPADAGDVILATNSNLANTKEGRVAVTANDTHVKNLDDAITVTGPGLTKTVTSPAADEGLTIALSTELAALEALLPANGQIQAAAMDSEAATSGHVATADGAGNVSFAAAAGGGATPVDLTWEAGENLAERDVVYLDQSTNTAFKLDSDATGAIKAGRLRGIVNEVGGISSAATGSVRLLGEVSGFTALTAGGDVYADATAGGYTQTKPTVTAGGGQVASIRIGHAATTTSIFVEPSIAEWLKRESLANDASLTIEHYTDALGRTRKTSAYISATEAGAELTGYASSNQDDSAWLRGGSGAGAVENFGSSTSSQAAIGNDGGNLTRQAQSFTVTAGRLTEVTYNLAANTGSPTGTMTWEIRDNDGGDPGNLLASGTHTPTASSNNTVTIKDSILLAAATTYHWVLFATDEGSFGSNNHFNLYHSGSSSSYANGSRNQSNDSGASWANAPNSDFNGTLTTSAESVNDKLAQSFEISPTATVNSVKLYLRKVGAPVGTMTCRIETDTAGDPSGSLADANATITVAESSLTTGYTEITFDFAVDFSLTGSTTYWIVLSTDRVASAINYVAWGGDFSAPSYADGEMKSEVSSSWGAETADAIFSVLPEDTAFEEIAVIGRWGGGTRDVAARFDDGAGANRPTNTTFKNLSGVTLDVTCIVELE